MIAIERQIRGRDELHSFINEYYHNLTTKSLEALFVGATDVICYLMFRPSKERLKELIDEYRVGREHPIFIFE